MEVKVNGQRYRVINANYEDADGTGITLEKMADFPKEEVEPTVEPKVEEVTQGQEYARTDPGDVYDLNIRDGVEQPKFEEEAREVAEQIAQEDTVDRTTVDGHYSYNRILKRMVDSYAPVETPVEAPAPAVVEEAPVAVDAPPAEVEEPTTEVVEEPTEPTVEVEVEEVPAVEEVAPEEEKFEELELPEEEEKKQ